MSLAIDENGYAVSPYTWHPDTPGELVESLADSAQYGSYFEICEENAAVLLAYIRGLERDSRALTMLRQAIDGEAMKREHLLKLARMGAFQLRTYYEYARTDWRALYGSVG
jgi:hypothetical protein